VQQFNRPYCFKFTTVPSDKLREEMESAVKLSTECSDELLTQVQFFTFRVSSKNSEGFDELWPDVEETIGAGDHVEVKRDGNMDTSSVQAPSAADTTGPNIEKDWMPGSQGAGADAGAGGEDGGQSTKGKGGAPETKKAGKKGKICAKDGCRAHGSKQCSRCRLVYYCNGDCQKADWKAHKPKCNAAVMDKTAQANKLIGTRIRAGAGAGAVAGAADPSSSTKKKSAYKPCGSCGRLVEGTLKCGICKSTCYCNLQCQQVHWKYGGHKQECRAPPAEAATSMRKGGSGAGAGASAGDDVGKEGGEEEECAICLEALVDPLAPCVEPSHRYCRGCVQEMQRQKLPSCPLCRVKMEDAESLFYESVQLNIRAGKASTQAQRDALYAKECDMLHRVLQVGPSFMVAQFNLGLMYEEGQGVQQDFKQAAAWYRKATEQGDRSPCSVDAEAQRAALHAKQIDVLHRVLRVDPLSTSAQCNLGYMYEQGQGVQQDFKQAVAWYRKAAEQGLADAQYNLGNMYHNGQGVQQDIKQAAAWYRKAAEQGIATAQYNLGITYREGKGVQQDFKQAAAWYRKAAEQGLAEAQHSLGIMYKRGEGVQQDSKQAAAWYRKAAEQGLAEAQHNLGIMYKRGEGVQQDSKQAAAWYRKAADQGHAEAQHNLGIVYEKGQGVQQDSKQAAAWYRKAAEIKESRNHI
jgi:TPR repeat protein